MSCIYHPDRNDPATTGLNCQEAIAFFQLINNANTHLGEVLWTPSLRTPKRSPPQNSENGNTNFLFFLSLSQTNTRGMKKEKERNLERHSKDWTPPSIPLILFVTHS
jgi:hypothetical protein